ncbi:hypothetical protein [Amycolatopsis anabasis]|uniref:hypothetical protein n=1 Tax=Amycolatopsis anabasis TaxID=1840409 RepID=UPI00131CCC1F|nr:hypothetical protein [Amycolatopsis anabasis]
MATRIKIDKDEKQALLAFDGMLGNGLTCNEVAVKAEFSISRAYNLVKILHRRGLLDNKREERTPGLLSLIYFCTEAGKQQIDELKPDGTEVDQTG